MRYLLTQVVLGPHEEIELSREEYEEIGRAMRNLFIALGLEEKFDLLLGNYFDYESELLNLALHHSIYRDLDWFKAHDHIHMLNRRLVNLMSAGRMYKDQIDHDLSTIYGKSSAKASAVDEEASRQYDTSLGYRFIEATRNYTQHRSLPVQFLSYPTHIEHVSVRAIRHFIEPKIQVKRLLQDGRFKKAVLAEFGDVEHISITPLVREYMDSIAKVHGRLRDEVSPECQTWGSVISEAQSRAEQVMGSDIVGLAVAKLDHPHSGYRDIQYVLDEPIKRRKGLEKRNSIQTFFSRSYVSSRLSDE